MSLEEKVEDYIQTTQGEDSYSSLGAEIIEDLKSLITSIQEQDSSSEKAQGNITLLWNVYKKLPDAFFYNYSQELLDVILRIPCHHIYEVFNTRDIFTLENANLNSQPESYDLLSLIMLQKYLTKVSKKELVLYVKTFAQDKFKNLQLRFVLIELLNYSIIHITKREVFIADLLPTILRLLYDTLNKFNKYKGRINNQEYSEVPMYLGEYTTNYEVWIREIVQKLLKTSTDIITETTDKESKASLLLISDLYDGKTREYIEDKAIGKSVLIAHYYTLFYFDLIWLFLEHGKALLSEDTQLEIRNSLFRNLAVISTMSSAFLNNYISQIRLLNIDPNILEYNKKDSNNLPSDSYHRLTIYNPEAMMHIAVQLSHSIEGAVVSSDYKLSCLFICLDRFFTWPTRNEELKRDALSAIVLLLGSLERYNPLGYINNLNRFGITLDKILEKILDYAGGPIDPKDRGICLELFTKIKKVISEKTMCDLILQIIRNTKNSALSGFMITEFKAGLTTALKTCGGGQEIKDNTSPFFNVNYIDKFFRLIKSTRMENPREEYEVIASCVNMLQLVYMRLSFLVKHVPDYMQLEFKEYCNVFRPGNLGILLNYGEKLIGLQNMIADDIELQKANIAEMQQNNPTDQALATYQMKFYELIMMFDSITRIGEIHKELKPLCAK